MEACIPAGPAGAIQPSGGCRITSTSDSLEFACDPGETILEAALRAGIPFAHACGGNARCSTCRIWLANDPAELPSPNAAEAALKERLALGSEIRLACQLRPTGAVNFRRLVLDESDLRIANQLDRRHPMQSGEIRNVAVLFFDVAGFTSIAKRMPPHDVMFLLNKFLAQVNKVLEKYGGYFDKTIGDGFVAIFGVKGAEACALRAVAAAIEILDTVEHARPIVRQLYDVEFYGRMGLHYGEALIGALGPPGEERLTVIGDVANMASRVEQANKDAGTSLLVTQELYEEVRDDVVSPDFLRVAIRGHTERKTLHEVTGLKPAARERVETLATLPVSDLPQRRWERLLDSAMLPEGGVLIVPQTRLDVVLTRRDGRVFAFNNHCPHARLPFFGAEIPEGAPMPPTPAESQVIGNMRISCRFHETVFDLETGKILSWCPALAADGTVPGLEIFGDVSKNEAPLEVFRCREYEGGIWVAL